MKTILAILTLAAATAAIPTAAAGPDCIQAVPWSHLCNGDVEAFLAHYGVGLAFDPKDPPVSGPSVECLQVYPWSELCGGDVVGFLGYYLGDVVVLS